VVSSPCSANGSIGLRSGVPWEPERIHAPLSPSSRDLSCSWCWKIGVQSAAPAENRRKVSCARSLSRSKNGFWIVRASACLLRDHSGMKPQMGITSFQGIALSPKAPSSSSVLCGRGLSPRTSPHRAFDPPSMLAWASSYSHRAACCVIKTPAGGCYLGPGGRRIWRQHLGCQLGHSLTSLTHPSTH